MPTKPNAIIIYRHDGGWAFNDERYGLVAEALIEGADTLVDKTLALAYRGDAPNVNRALLRFIEGPGIIYASGNVGPWVFMKKVGESNGGTDYEVVDPSPLAGHRVWLCPELLCYFEVAPRSITLDVRALGPAAAAGSPEASAASRGIHPWFWPSPSPL